MQGRKAVCSTRESSDQPSAPAAAPEAIERAVALLRECRRPLIAIGGGAIRAGAEVLRLALQDIDAPSDRFERLGLA